jgi:carbon monoxide dehydrogenase subunit G
MQLRAVFGFFLALCLLPALASAHGPTRQKLTKDIEIDAPAAKVWEIIGDFQDMSWHPAVKETTGEGGNGIDATRVLDLGGGATISEFLYKYNAEKMSYSYRISEVDVAVLPVNNYSSTLSVKETGDGTSKVTWKGAFYRGYMLNDPPEELNEAAAIAAVTGVYEAGLANIKTLAEAGS